MKLNRLITNPKEKAKYVQYSIKGDAVQRVNDTTVSFTCPKGHIHTIDYSKLPAPQRMGKVGLDMMVRYWKDRLTIVCPMCLKSKIKEAK